MSTMSFSEECAVISVGNTVFNPDKNIVRCTYYLQKLPDFSYIYLTVISVSYGSLRCSVDLIIFNFYCR